MSITPAAKNTGAKKRRVEHSRAEYRTKLENSKLQLSTSACFTPLYFEIKSKTLFSKIPANAHSAGTSVDLSSEVTCKPCCKDSFRQKHLHKR